MRIEVSDIESAVSDVLLKIFADEASDDRREQVTESGIDGLFEEGHLLKEMYFALETLGRVHPCPVADALAEHLAVSYLKNRRFLSAELIEAIEAVEARGGWLSLVERRNPDDERIAFWTPDVAALLMLDRASRELVLFSVTTDDVRAVQHASLVGVMDLVRYEPVHELARMSVSAGEYERIVRSASLVNAIVFTGAMFRIIQQTADYVKIRTQFGRPVGSFQAVRHLLADCYVRAEQAQAMVQYASWLEAEGGGAEEDAFGRLGAADVLALVSRSYLDVVRVCIQATGGIGFTWEHELHQHYKRAIYAASDGSSAARGEESIENPMRRRSA